MDMQARLDELSARSLEELRLKHELRERAIRVSREVVRTSANAIRAVHRNEPEHAGKLVGEAAALVRETREMLAAHPDLYFTGYTQDAQKEYAEACAVLAFIAGTTLPLPAEIGVETPSYLNGLAEAASELRRYILDALRRDDDSRSEELMRCMDEVYNVLVVMDFPDALTSGLRRTTDQLRGVLERTRGDLTMTMRQRRLERLLQGGSTTCGGPSPPLRLARRPRGPAPSAPPRPARHRRNARGALPSLVRERGTGLREPGQAARSSRAWSVLRAAGAPTPRTNGQARRAGSWS